MIARIVASFVAAQKTKEKEAKKKKIKRAPLVSERKKKPVTSVPVFDNNFKKGF